MNPIKENIIKSLGLTNLGSEEKEDLLFRIGFLIYQNFLMRAMETLSNEDKSEFEKILDNNGKAEDILDFFKKKVSNFEEIINTETEKFRNEASVALNK